MNIPLQRKKFVKRPEGTDALRVSHKKARQTSERGAKSAQFKIKCGCCDASIEIYYSDDPEDPNSEMLEINGIDGSVANWREIFLPLLQLEYVEGELIDVSPKAIRARKKLEEMREEYVSPFLVSG